MAAHGQIHSGSQMMLHGTFPGLDFHIMPKLKTWMQKVGSNFLDVKHQGAGTETTTTGLFCEARCQNGLSMPTILEMPRIFELTRFGSG